MDWVGGGEKWGSRKENNDESAERERESIERRGGKLSGEGGKKTVRADLKTEVLGLCDCLVRMRNRISFPFFQKSEGKAGEKINQRL